MSGDNDAGSASTSDDLELLRTFEPVLCFAGGEREERFLPLPVEGFLADCRLYSGRPGRLGKGAELTERWDEAAADLGAGVDGASGAARARALGRLELDHRAFLVAVDPKAARDAARSDGPDPTATLGNGIGVSTVGALLIAGAGLLPPRLAILFWALVALGALLLVGGALVLLRRRIGRERTQVLFADLLAVAGLVAAGFAWHSGRPVTASVFGFLGGLVLMAQLFVRLRASFSQVVSEAWTALASAGLVTAVVLVAWRSLWALLVPLALLQTLVVLYGPALTAGIMALLSPLRLKASSYAAARERDRRARPAQTTFPYYGRVSRRPAGGGGELICLQYFYLYAFNDWRHQGGFNYHEGDWEAATVVLESRPGGPPRPLSVAVSRHHRGERRPWAEAVRVASERGEHPVLYVAAGSHALYFEPGSFDLPDLVDAGPRRRLLAAWKKFRDDSMRSGEKGQRRAQRLFRRKVERQRIGDGGASDRADGTGVVLGAVRPDSADPHRPRSGWAAVLLADHGSDWIDFPGRWGQRSLLDNESGPPGPKWDRQGGIDRLWSDPIGWADELPTNAREPALRGRPADPNRRRRP